MTVTSYKSIILLPAKKVALYQWLDGLFPAIGCEPQPGCGAGRRFKPDRSLSVFLPSLRFPHRLETKNDVSESKIEICAKKWSESRGLGIFGLPFYMICLML
jgi:hypothetical protein